MGPCIVLYPYPPFKTTFMYYVLQNNLFREHGFEALKETLERNKLEYEIVKYIPFSGQLEDLKTERKDVFFFGSGGCGKVTEKYGWKPGHLINENFTFEKYLPVYGENLLNGDGVILSIDEMANDLFAEEFFARPLEDTKQFTGQVFDKEGWDDYVKDNSVLTPETKIFFARSKNYIQQEIRCWMVDGKPVTISQYKIGSRANYLNMDHNEEAVLFASKMAKIFSPARAFCLDICLHQDEYKIVEIGCINHCGFYDANMSKLIQALEEAYNDKT